MKDTCDRCGRVFEETFEPSMRLTLVYPSVLQHINQMHLCAECEAELITWLERGVNNGNA